MTMTDLLPMAMDVNESKNGPSGGLHRNLGLGPIGLNPSPASPPPLQPPNPPHLIIWLGLSSTTTTRDGQSTGRVPQRDFVFSN